MSNLQKLFYILNKNQKANIIYLSLILLLVSTLEIFFLHSILILVEIITSNRSLNFINYEFINFGKHENIKVALIGFIFLFLIKSLISIFAIKYEANFIYRTRENLTKNFFDKYTNLPKLLQIKLSVANLIKKIVIQVEYLTIAMKSISTLFLELTILLLISIYLLTINFYISIYIFIIFSISSLILIKFNKKKIVSVGKDQIEHNEKIIQTVNEIFSSLKFFKSKKFNENTTKKFNFHNKSLSDIAIIVAFKNGYIRPLFELVILIVLISVLSLIFFLDLNLKDFLPQFAVFLAASYRLMPSYARILTSVQTYKYNIQPINEYYSDQKNIFDNHSLNISKQNIDFNSQIEFKNVSFSYNSEKKNNSKFIFDNINLKLDYNSKNCIIGESGAGKSTFLDIFMGLVEPFHGEIYIDNKKTRLSNSNWQDYIGFVSQNIYITNDTLKSNIAFGFDDAEIDENKILECLKTCNLIDFVDKLKNGINTKLSDLGTNISGGQKQRIGIARALYTSPKILVLDEPTNNLDDKNQHIIIKNLLKLKDTTLLVTTHKNELISEFDNTFEVKEKNIKKIDEIK